MIKFIGKHLQLLLLVLMLIAIGLTVLFLYENFYKTLIEAEEVTVLQRQVSPVFFKEATWNEVMARLDEKLAPKAQLSGLRDPFK